MEITNTVQDIINLALANSHTKAAQVSSSSLLKWFNIIFKDFWNAIVSECGENYFFEIWKTEGIVAENGEYFLPTKDDTSDGMKKLIAIERKENYQSLVYTKCRKVDLKALPRDWSWYLDNQPASDPIYFLADESAFIAPNYKTTDLEDGGSNLLIKFVGILRCKDLAVTDTLDKIKIDVDFSWIIALGMEEYILKARGRRGEAAESKASYEYEKSVAIDKLSHRDQGENIATIPNDTNLQYGE